MAQTWLNFGEKAEMEDKAIWTTKELAHKLYTTNGVIKRLVKAKGLLHYSDRAGGYVVPVADAPTVLAVALAERGEEKKRQKAGAKAAKTRAENKAQEEAARERAEKRLSAAAAKTDK